jgi:hypothetical protein
VRKQSKAGSERAAVKLLIQPGDGLKEILKGISNAKESIDIVIFRFDQSQVEEALAEAVRRGVAVCALIASINRAGDESLRKLELRLLGAGVRVARTDNDLIRYHGKFMIIDQRQLYLLAFNWTHADIDRSRSFGIRHDQSRSSAGRGAAVRRRQQAHPLGTARGSSCGQPDECAKAIGGLHPEDQKEPGDLRSEGERPLDGEAA